MPVCTILNYGRGYIRAKEASYTNKECLHSAHRGYMKVKGSFSKPGRLRQREEPGKDCFRISDVFATLLILNVAQITSVSAKVFVASSSLTTEERLW